MDAEKPNHWAKQEATRIRVTQTVRGEISGLSWFWAGQELDVVQAPVGFVPADRRPGFIPADHAVILLPSLPSRARLEGRAARREGKDDTQNPYDMELGFNDALEWDAGWTETAPSC